MKTKFFAAIITALMFVGAANAQTTKIGYTNVDYILNNLPDAKDIENKLTRYCFYRPGFFFCAYKIFESFVFDFLNMIYTINLKSKTTISTNLDHCQLMLTITRFL